MFQLIVEMKGLPLRHQRYCCRLIKEVHGTKSVVVTGVRKTESRSRNNHKEIIHQCIKGEDKIMLAPILNWTTKEIWEFIRTKIGHSCVLYSMGFRRIGCVGCPNAYYKTKLKELAKIAYRPTRMGNFPIGMPVMYKLAGEAWEGTYTNMSAHMSLPGFHAEADKVAAIINKINPKLKGYEVLTLFGAASMMHFAEGAKNAGRNLTRETCKCPECGVKIRQVLHKLQ